MKIVVLGAKGQVGSVVFAGLMKTHNVVGTSRSASDALLTFDPFIDDWALLGKVDTIINCIGQIEPTSTSSFEHVHVGLIKILLLNRAKIGNPRIVQISALGAAVDHRNDFLRTKGIADELLLKQPDTVILRPSIVCTHRTTLVRKMLMLSKIAGYTGMICLPLRIRQTRIQPVMPGDLADGIKAVLTPRHERIINIVGPDAISVDYLLKQLITVRHQRLLFLDVPERLMNIFVNQVIARSFPRLINAQQYELLHDDNIADPQPARQLLGRPLESVQNFFINEFKCQP